MPRSKIGNKRPIPSKGVMEAAVQDVMINNLSIRTAADKYKVAKSAIGRYVKQIKANKESPEFSYHPKFDVHRVFSLEEEQQLVDYLKYAASVHYGLTIYQTRKLAFEYASALGKNVPMWTENKIAGISWYRMFRARHADLSLRKPEATSLARSTAFNKSTVTAFFTNYKNVLNKAQFQPHQIWNADESGCSTVHIPPKILAQKGAKQIGTMTSGERGANVTIIAAVNGVGNTVPPLFVFPRVHLKEHMLKGAPPGSVGAANPSGWSNEAIFYKFIEHFLSHAQPSLAKPHLLIYDNHESHISLNVINKAKESGLYLLTIPPHTSHKLQPLDRSVFGPFKNYYYKAMSEWMCNPGNAGKPVTIYDVAEIAGKAYELSFTPKNILSGFKIAGIIPLNENIFEESEFLSSYVTDRPMTTNDNDSHNMPSTSGESGHHKENASTSKTLSPETLNRLERPCTPMPAITTTTPIMVRPLPKAGIRKTTHKRKKGKSLILTDTPVKDEIELQKTKKVKKAPSKASVVKKVFDTSSSESEADVVTNDDELDDVDGYQEIEDHEVELSFLSDSVENGDYILVRCDGQKFSQYFVAVIIKKPQNEAKENKHFEIKYLKKMPKTDSFRHDAESDIFSIPENEIVLKLPPPTPVGGTVRSKNLLRFSVDFEGYNMG